VTVETLDTSKNKVFIATNFSSSNYYYSVKSSFESKKHQEHKEILDLILQIRSEEFKFSYGAKMLAKEMARRGYIHNHKTVLDVERDYDLLSTAYNRYNSKYNSYKGNVGKTADRIIKRGEKASEPGIKIVTDVTEFRVKNKKLYLTTFIDLFNNEILSYNIDIHPTAEFVNIALKNVLPKLQVNAIIHSDQGFHYQLPNYQYLLNQASVIQSMSRKSSPEDNGLQESEFHIIKVHTSHHRKYKDIDELRNDIERFIYHYNYQRIQKRLGYLTPVEYRERYSSLSGTDNSSKEPINN
jgi:putative transposase